MVGSEVFLMKQKHQFIYPNEGNEFMVLNDWERRLLCKSVFIPIERWTLILKLIEREIFLMKPKHQYHLSQQSECVYGFQSWKQRTCLSQLIDELWF